MLCEVVDGSGPILGGRGLGSSLFIRRVTSGVGAGFGEGVSGSESLCFGEKWTCSHRFFAVGLGWGFLRRSEPNQAETDAAGTEESLHPGGMGK